MMACAVKRKCWVPSPSKKQKKILCIIGDSHLGSVKRAVDAGLIDLAGFETEFWGAQGPTFRQLNLIENAYRAQTDEAAEAVLQVNGQGRAHVAPGDFDVFLFYGARLRMAEFMPPMLQHMAAPNGALSRAVLTAATERFIQGTRAARVAMHFANAGARVYFAPTPLFTDGVIDFEKARWAVCDFPLAWQADSPQRAPLWQALTDAFAAADVGFVPQPEDTICRGIFTKADYATDGAADTRDVVHKSPAFAAVMLRAFLAQLK